MTQKGKGREGVVQNSKDEGPWWIDLIDVTSGIKSDKNPFGFTSVGVF